MIAMAKEIPNTGGLLGWIMGDNDMETFASQMKAFGEAIVEFSETVDGNVSSEAVTAAANAGLVMAEIQKSIPEEKWFDGKMSLDEFGKKIKSFGKSIAGYADEVSEIDVTTLEASVSAASLITTIAKKAAEIDPDEVGNLADAIDEISSIDYESLSAIGDIDLTSVSSTLTSLKALCSDISGVDSTVVSTFVDAINELGDIDISGITGNGAEVANGFITGFADALSSGTQKIRIMFNLLFISITTAVSSKKQIFNTMGIHLINSLISGMTKMGVRVPATMSRILSSTVSTFHSYYPRFYSAGAYLVEGFANGISANTYKAAARASAMASAAERAAKAQLKEHSPSKVFYDIGDNAGLGFVNALYDYASIAYKAGSGMAEYAQKGLSGAIARIGDLVNSGMDAQPTIAPVLDLSNVENGVGAINGLFANGPSIGLMTNLDAISYGRARAVQNGANDDVVSAIEKLSGMMGTGGDTYQINGITYSSGTEVADAIQTLVRAAIIEGRK